MKILDNDLGSVNVQVKDLYFLNNCPDYQDNIYKLLERNSYKLSILNPDDIYYLKFSNTLDCGLIMENKYIVDFDEAVELSLEKLEEKIDYIKKNQTKVCQNFWNMKFTNLEYDKVSLQKDIKCYMDLYNNLINDYETVCKIKMKRR